MAVKQIYCMYMPIFRGFLTTFSTEFVFAYILLHLNVKIDYKIIFYKFKKKFQLCTVKVNYRQIINSTAIF